ncbi:HD domain-containing protein [Paenibacillus flagellatus]|uniref:Phosphohydrolase n=1 Tax=Paenibacillus flagellatus TaxID=2211139 RepID=A0A2V5K2V2_9BACL|nr:HD domain-containing protein [Paenibacillus flagellatus]PYI51893.1 phosphohydrolase [Paenibacillus flagellatus]
MERERVLSRATEFARAFHEGEASGHDWPHIERVVRMARRLAAAEGADPFVCELAALLHDVADEKLNPSKEEGLARVREWLQAESVEAETAGHVMDIISTMSYGAGENTPMRTAEGRVVRDADRLDAIGAIAIARTFVYAGWKGHPIHDPALPPREQMTREQYRHGKTTAINHFYEKLLKLKRLLHTETAKTIADERHRFMENYLEQFHKEWNGDA